MTKTLTFIFLFFLTSWVNAQERISADRPDQTEGATLTPYHYFQAEFGFGRENVDKEDFNIIYPTTLLKYGLSKRFEIQLLEKFISTHEQMIPQTKTTSGFLPFTIGLRSALCEEINILPKTSFIIRIGIPTFTSKSFKPDHFVPTFLLAMEKTVTNWKYLELFKKTRWHKIALMRVSVFISAIMSSSMLQRELELLTPRLIIFLEQESHFVFIDDDEWSVSIANKFLLLLELSHINPAIFLEKN